MTSIMNKKGVSFTMYLVLYSVINDNWLLYPLEVFIRNVISGNCILCTVCYIVSCPRAKTQGYLCHCQRSNNCRVVYRRRSIYTYSYTYVHIYIYIYKLTNIMIIRSFCQYCPRGLIMFKY